MCMRFSVIFRREFPTIPFKQGKSTIHAYKSRRICGWSWLNGRIWGWWVLWILGKIFFPTSIVLHDRRVLWKSVRGLVERMGIQCWVYDGTFKINALQFKCSKKMQNYGIDIDKFILKKSPWTNFVKQK